MIVVAGGSSAGTSRMVTAMTVSEAVALCWSVTVKVKVTVVLEETCGAVNDRV